MTTFNGLQRPDSMTVGQNISYTVPEGKVAKVTIILSAAHGIAVSGTGLGNFTTGNDSVNEQVNIVLKEGDIVSSTRTTGAGSTAIGVSTTTIRAAEASTILLVNGVQNCVVRARVAASGQGGSSPSGSLTSVGTADFGFIAEEYFG